MSNKDIYILGIESSCDDTSAAILKNDKVLSNIIANQDIHKDYGGVVPELASRAHLSNIIPVVHLDDIVVIREGFQSQQSCPEILLFPTAELLKSAADQGKFPIKFVSVFRQFCVCFC